MSLLIAIKRVSIKKRKAIQESGLRLRGKQGEKGSKSKKVRHLCNIKFSTENNEEQHLQGGFSKNAKEMTKRQNYWKIMRNVEAWVFPRNNQAPQYQK